MDARAAGTSRTSRWAGASHSSQFQDCLKEKGKRVPSPPPQLYREANKPHKIEPCSSFPMWIPLIKFHAK